MNVCRWYGVDVFYGFGYCKVEDVREESKESSINWWRWCGKVREEIKGWGWWSISYIRDWGWYDGGGLNVGNRVCGVY